MINYKKSNWNEGTNLIAGLTNLESGVGKCVDILNQLIESAQTEKPAVQEKDDKVSTQDFLIHQHSGIAHQVLFDELRMQIIELERKVSSLTARVEALENGSAEESETIMTATPKTSSRKKK